MTHRIGYPERITDLRPTITHNRDRSGLFLCLDAVPVIFAGVRNRKEQTPAVTRFRGSARRRRVSGGLQCDIARRALDAELADLDRFAKWVGSRLFAAQWSRRQPNRVWFGPSTYFGKGACNERNPGITRLPRRYPRARPDTIRSRDHLHRGAGLDGRGHRQG